MLMAPKIFWGERLPPEILNRHYKIEQTYHHSAKFCNDWPMELGDLTRTKNYYYKCQQNISPL